MAKKEPVDEAVVIRKMIEILNVSDGVCGQGTGGMPDKAFDTAVVNAFKSQGQAVWLHVFKNLPTYRKNKAFKAVQLSKPKKGMAGICLKPEHVPSVADEILHKNIREEKTATKEDIIRTISDRISRSDRISSEITQDEIREVLGQLQRMFVEHMECVGQFRLPGLFAVKVKTEKDKSPKLEISAHSDMKAVLEKFEAKSKEEEDE